MNRRDSRVHHDIYEKEGTDLNSEFGKNNVNDDDDVLIEDLESEVSSSSDSDSVHSSDDDDSDSVHSSDDDDSDSVHSSDDDDD